MYHYASENAAVAWSLEEKKSTSRPERKPYEMNNCKYRDFIPKYTQEYNNENIIESAMRAFGC